MGISIFVSESGMLSLSGVIGFCLLFLFISLVEYFFQLSSVSVVKVLQYNIMFTAVLFVTAVINEYLYGWGPGGMVVMFPFVTIPSLIILFLFKKHLTSLFEMTFSRPNLVIASPLLFIFTIVTLFVIYVFALGSGMRN